MDRPDISGSQLKLALRTIGLAAGNRNFVQGGSIVTDDQRHRQA